MRLAATQELILGLGRLVGQRAQQGIAPESGSEGKCAEGGSGSPLTAAVLAR